jgi:hypothetical protein
LECHWAAWPGAVTTEVLFISFDTISGGWRGSAEMMAESHVLEGNNEPLKQI